MTVEHAGARVPNAFRHEALEIAGVSILGNRDDEVL